MHIYLTAIEYSCPSEITCPELRQKLRTKVGYVPVCVMTNAIDYMTVSNDGTEMFMRCGDSFIVTESIDEINTKIHATILYPFN